jgi:hypothetical protein
MARQTSRHTLEQILFVESSIPPDMAKRKSENKTRTFAGIFYTAESFHVRTTW